MVDRARRSAAGGHHDVGGRRRLPDPIDVVGQRVRGPADRDHLGPMRLIHPGNWGPKESRTWPIPATPESTNSSPNNTIATRGARAHRHRVDPSRRQQPDQRRSHQFARLRQDLPSAALSPAGRMSAPARGQPSVGHR